MMLVLTGVDCMNMDIVPVGFRIFSILICDRSCDQFFMAFLPLQKAGLPRCYIENMGAQWLSGKVLDSRPRGCGFEPHRVTALYP